MIDVWTEPEREGAEFLAIRFQGSFRKCFLIQIKPPPSSYKPTPSRAGNVGTAANGGTGRPQSNQGRGFSNELTDKAN